MTGASIQAIALMHEDLPRSLGAFVPELNALSVQVVDRVTAAQLEERLHGALRFAVISLRAGASAAPGSSARSDPPQSVLAAWSGAEATLPVDRLASALESVWCGAREVRGTSRDTWRTTPPEGFFAPGEAVMLVELESDSGTLALAYRDQATHPPEEAAQSRSSA